MKSVRYLATSLLLGAAATGCGGGGGDDSDMSGQRIFQGRVTQRGAAARSLHLGAKHSNGEVISDVKVCAFGSCAVTDKDGEFGFNADAQGLGKAQFSLDGHGIATSVSVTLPDASSDVILDFANSASGVTVEHMETGVVRTGAAAADGHGAE